MIVNGKDYKMWGSFVEKKDEFIGGLLRDDGDFIDRAVCKESSAITVITDIELRPNGKDSASFHVVGEKFSCGFDVGVGGFSSTENGWLVFTGYAGHTWRIKRKETEEAG